MTQPPTPVLEYAGGAPPEPADPRLTAQQFGPNLCLRRGKPSTAGFVVAVLVWMFVSACLALLAGSVLAGVVAVTSRSRDGEQAALVILGMVVFVAPLVSLAMQLSKRSRHVVAATLTADELIIAHLWGGISSVRRFEILRIETVPAGRSLGNKRLGVIRVHLADGRCVRLFAMAPWDEIVPASAALCEAMGQAPGQVPGQFPPPLATALPATAVPPPTPQP